jgi:hypothetical protein
MRRAAVMCLAWLGWAAWGSGQTRVDLRTQSKAVDFSGASSTKPSKSGTVLPGQCSVGETFFKTDAAAGKNLYGCTGPNSWTLLSGVDLPPVSGEAGKILTNDGAVLEWKAAGGDVTGPVGTLTVTGLQGRAVDSGVPSDGDVLSWSGVRNRWEPAAPAGSYVSGPGIAIAGLTISVDDAVVPSYQVGSGAPATSCAAGRDLYTDASNGNLYFCRGENTWQLLSPGAHSHGAGDIASGTLGLARGGTNQTSWTAGRCVQVSADGTRLESADGACGGGGSNPLDRTTVWWREEFQNLGLGWAATCTSGTSARTGGSYPRLGLWKLTTGATAGNSCVLAWNYISTAQSVLGAIRDYGSWDSYFAFQLPGSGDLTGTEVYVGYSTSSGAPDGTTNFIGLRYLAGTDSTLKFITQISTGSCLADSQVVPSAGAWYTLRVRHGGAGTITFSLNGGPEQSCSSYVTPNAVTPVFSVKTGEAAAKSLVLDYWYWAATELSR